MVIAGKIFKGSRLFWAAEAPVIGVFTQGTSRSDAEMMLADAVQAVVHRDGFKITVERLDVDDVIISANDPAALAAYVLKYQRQINHLTLADVAKKLGVSSISSYAAYEQGKREPSLSKFVELLGAVAPDLVLTVTPKTSSKRKAKAAR